MFLCLVDKKLQENAKNFGCVLLYLNMDLCSLCSFWVSPHRSKFHNFFVFNYVFLFFIIFKIDKFIF